MNETKIIPARNEKLDDDTEHGALVYSHPSITEPGKHVVRVIAVGGDIDLATDADSRGEALDLLADYFMRLSREIRKRAWTPGVDDANTPEGK